MEGRPCQAGGNVSWGKVILLLPMLTCVGLNARALGEAHQKTEFPKSWAKSSGFRVGCTGT